MPTSRISAVEPSLGAGRDELQAAAGKALRTGRLDEVATLLHLADGRMPGLASVASLLTLHCRLVRRQGRPSDPDATEARALATARAIAFKRHIRSIARDIRRAQPATHVGRHIDVHTYFLHHLGRQVDFGRGVAIDLFRTDESAARIAALIGPAVDERTIRGGGSARARDLLAADENVRPKTSCLKTDFLDSRTEGGTTSCPAERGPQPTNGDRP